MKVTLSEYLSRQKPVLKKLVALLSKTFGYVSLLGTDVSGRSFMVRDKLTNISDNSWVERGFVVRVYDGGRYYEYSFNEI